MKVRGGRSVHVAIRTTPYIYITYARAYVRTCTYVGKMVTKLARVVAVVILVVLPFWSPRIGHRFGRAPSLIKSKCNGF